MHGVSLSAAMEGPVLPTQFLYRPFEAGTAAQTARPVSREDESEASPEQIIDDGTRYLMRVVCSSCLAAHWLPAQEGAHHTLWLQYGPKLHAAGCPHAVAAFKLQPSLRKVGENYKLRAHSGGDASAVEVSASVVVGAGSLVRLSLALSRGPHAFVIECRPVEE